MGKRTLWEYVLAAACHWEILVDACNGVQLQRHDETFTEQTIRKKCQSEGSSVAGKAALWTSTQPSVTAVSSRVSLGLSILLGNATG
jgi:hypothetical protein